MEMTRRSVLAGGAGAALLLAPDRPRAQPGDPPIRRAIPTTGELLPVVGLGTAGRWERVRSDAELEALRESLVTLHTGGASVVDTSDDYGMAEEVVGRLAEELGLHDALFLATKVSTTGREAGARQVELSFKRLRTSRLDLVAVHNLEDPATNLRLLRELKGAGRIRYVGITTSVESQHDELLALMRREPMDFIQVDYALDNRVAAERVLPLARERRLAVMVNLPLGRGRLLGAVRGRPLPPWAAEFDCASWAQFFLKYVVANEAVTCAIPGMGTPEHVRDDLGALRGRLPDEAARKRMEALIEGL